MADKRPRQTLGDYMAVAISPVLIMALVGSLVFFLLEVLYVGNYESRLKWILFFFVFGSVLIARISMRTEIAGRAGLYGLVLGGLVWVGLLLYVDYRDSGPLAPFGWAVNAFLIVLIWWCAHRLTWDCTLIDDKIDASGAGLLEAAGLEKPAGAAAAEEPELPPAQKRKKERFPLLAWWDRYQDFREERQRRPHTPGVWVVYFSLAALPLFGLGQALIPEGEVDRRRYTFLLMAVYVSSGLGLLLTTSFLGLRRYLRQRGLKMPVALAGTWLTVGGALIAALLLGGAVLPRPDGDTRWLEWTGLQSADRKASPWDLKGDSPGKGKGGRRVARRSKDQGGKAGGANRSGQQGGNDQRQGGNRGNQQNQQQGGQKGQSQQQQGEGKGGQGKGQSEGNGQEKGKNDNQDEDSNPDSDDGDQDASSSDRSFTPPENGLTRKLSSTLENISPVVRWVLYGILGLAAAYALIRVALAWLRYLAHFTDWARRLLAALQAWWQNLFGWWSTGPREEAEGEDAERGWTRLPFAAYPDPFRDGMASRYTPEELVRYSFEALQAWAWERDLARQPGETPLEFVHRLGGEFPGLEADARRLVSLYVRAAYARGALPASCPAVARQFWNRLAEVTERPLSAGVGAGEAQ
jgi:hypothetical protein